VAAIAGMIAAQDVGKGDRVIIYMPMIPEAVMAMLACARLGAVHSVVFGGFAAKELASRIDDCNPKLVLTASCGVEPSRIVQYKPLLDQAIEMAKHKVPRVILLQRPQGEATMVAGRDLDWAATVKAAAPHGCVPVQATDPLYILYTSGTTGYPKGVVRDTGGYCVALAWSMKNLYGVKPGEVYWCASDVGWVVGHSYIVYGPLIYGATSILYEGKPVGTPDSGAFWRVISEHKAVALFTAPTAFRAIKSEDPEAAPDLRPLEIPHAVPRRRARRPADRRMGAEALGRSRRRSLVADRDRLGDLRQLRGPRSDAGQARLDVGAVARLEARGDGRSRPADEGGRSRRAGRQAALAARHFPDPVERRRALQAGLHDGVPRLLQNRRRGLHR
jgi:acyl-CoA synthetase (AMP-forming)/AMP-acid ligase II